MADWIEIREEGDVTDEMLRIARDYAAAAYDEDRSINTLDLLKEIERTYLPDGSKYDLGNSVTSPACKRIVNESRFTLKQLRGE